MEKIFNLTKEKILLYFIGIIIIYYAYVIQRDFQAISIFSTGIPVVYKKFEFPFGTTYFSYPLLIFDVVFAIIAPYIFSCLIIFIHKKVRKN